MSDTWESMGQDPSALAPGIISKSGDPQGLKLPSGWQLHAGSPATTQEQVDAFIDQYYRTGPGENLNDQDYSVTYGQVCGTPVRRRVQKLRSWRLIPTRNDSLSNYTVDR